MSDHPSADAPSAIDTPEWVRHAVFYQIFPDRFARSERVPKASNLEAWDAPPTPHGYKGGDLLGVLDRLDYLQELGVTALYFNPVFRSASNHRYHTHDYFQIDPMLGGNEALAELIRELKRRGMRIMLDGVFNHASRGFFQFSDLLENGGASAYLDWFHVYRFPLNAYGGGELGYGAWWNLPALPKLNTDTPAVREFLWSVGSYWLEQGIDGWRLDVPNEIDDDDFWREFRRRCRAVNPECYLVGEIWGEAERWLQGDQFDAVMNYPFTRAALGFVASEIDADEVAKSGYGEILPLGSEAFARQLKQQTERYPRAVTEVQLNLLGSHDTPRALTVLGGDEAAMRMAVQLQFTLPGAPCIYYGDEIGLEGGHDPDSRQGMPWSHAGRNAGLFEHHRRLIALRAEHAALRTGAFEVLHASGEVFAYRRRDGRDDLIGLLNVGSRARRVDLVLDRGAAAYHDLLAGVEVCVAGERLTVERLPARSGALLLGDSVWRPR